MSVVAFIGLGVMGGPMAAHLAAAGHELAVYNRSIEKARAWCARSSGRVAAGADDAVRGAASVITMVPDDASLAELFLRSSALLDALEPGALVVDHSTASPRMARQLATLLAKRHVRFADAPVSGGQSGAERGTLAVMVGCKAADLADVEALAAPYAARIRRIGEPGSGQAAKLVNQVCIAGILQGLSEGLALGMRSGLDMDATLEVIASGAAQSWQMDNRARTMLAGKFDFGFAVDLMRKDLLMALDAAHEVDVDLPLAALVEAALCRLQAGGGGRLDNSSLIRTLLPEGGATTGKEVQGD